jgi:UTP--glucose-1-phosphate uridylyltransferase
MLSRQDALDRPGVTWLGFGPQSMTEHAFDGETQALLHRYAFDEETFRRLRDRLKSGGAKLDQNRVRGTVEPPRAGEVKPLPPLGSDDRRRLEARGLDSLRAGEVGAVVLAGGMATRFGGIVKAAAQAIEGHSFLDLKLADVRATAAKAHARVPVYLMTSFATDDEVTRLAREASSDRAAVETFSQYVSVRLTPSGDVFLEDGKPSLYAPGHGDLSFALRRSGVLERFREAGGRVLFMSNVDNVAATLDPGVIGAHLESGAAITVELAPKEKGDKGGAPARVDGRLQIVESFRFPADFDQDRIDVFNTNTFVFDAAAIDRDFDLTWFAVKKTVDGRDAIQFERLVGELTAFLPANYLRVEREGPDGRFLPAKDPEELAKRQPAIRAILGGRGIL